LKSLRGASWVFVVISIVACLATFSFPFFWGIDFSDDLKIVFESKAGKISLDVIVLSNDSNGHYGDFNKPSEMNITKDQENVTDGEKPVAWKAIESDPGIMGFNWNKTVFYDKKRGKHVIFFGIQIPYWFLVLAFSVAPIRHMAIERPHILAARQVDVIIISVISCLVGISGILEGLRLVNYFLTGNQIVTSFVEKTGFFLFGVTVRHPIAISFFSIVESLMFIVAAIFLLKLRPVGWWILLVITFHGMIAGIFMMHQFSVMSLGLFGLNTIFAIWLFWRKSLFLGSNVSEESC